MIDRFALVLLRPVVERAAAVLAARGVTADQATLTGFAFGMAAAVMIGFGYPLLAILPLLLNRALDGLDGALARRTAATERGAFLDIALDFLFYAAIPLAFAFSNPAQNALAGAVLLAAFVGTGSSFLAFAIIAEKRGLKMHGLSLQVLLLPWRTDRGRRDDPLLSRHVPVAAVLPGDRLCLCRHSARSRR
jgi:phosphatidylglycerophosphate synthase